LTFPAFWEDVNTGVKYPRKWLEDLPESQQKALGWYVVTDNMPTLNSDEVATPLPLSFDGESIIQSYTVSTVQPVVY